MPKCDQCGNTFYAGDGVWDDDDNICGACVAALVRQSSRQAPSEGRTAPPSSTRTFRVRGLARAHEIAAGLINHGQWFTFSRSSNHSPIAEYEFILDDATPVSGYNFIPTADQTLYEGDERYGLRVR